MTRRALVLFCALCTCSALGACEDEPPDPRFATPEATVRSLLRAYGVEDMSQEEIQRHMRVRGRFELRDELLYRGCFSEPYGREREGLAGFVFGTIAAAKDDMIVQQVGARAHVFPNPERRDRSVVLEERDGEWKILLDDSVPADIRRRLLEEYARIAARNRRQGGPEASP